MSRVWPDSKAWAHSNFLDANERAIGHTIPLFHKQKQQIESERVY